MEMGGMVGDSWWIYTEPASPVVGKLFHAHLRPDESLVDLITNALSVLSPAVAVAATTAVAPQVPLACALFAATLRLSQNRDKSYDLFAFRVEEKTSTKKKQIVAFTGSASDRRFVPPIGIPLLMSPFDLIFGFIEGSLKNEHIAAKVRMGVRNYGLTYMDLMKLHPLAWPFVPFMKVRNNPFAIRRIADMFRQEPVPNRAS